MRLGLGLTLLAGLAATGCRSEEQRIAEFRERFLAECTQSARAQPNSPPGVDSDTICACVADRLFGGKSTGEIDAVLKDEAARARATTQCALQQVPGVPEPALAKEE
jgi:hypothetical protein